MAKAPSERCAPTSPASGGGRNIASKRAKTYAKTLRKSLTEAEWQLWHKLKQRQVLGLHFRKQHPIGPYIVDFCCVKAGVIIEVDGDSHYNDQAEMKDLKRTEFLNDNGWIVYRYLNNQIYKYIDDVLIDIHRNLRAHASASPACGGGGREADGGGVAPRKEPL